MYSSVAVEVILLSVYIIECVLIHVKKKLIAQPQISPLDPLPFVKVARCFASC
jgi:hypothetical protein